MQSPNPIIIFHLPGKSVLAADSPLLFMGLDVARFWQVSRQIIEEDEIHWITLGVIFTAALLMRFVPGERRRIRAAIGLFAFSLFLLALACVFQAAGKPGVFGAIRWAGRLIGGMAVINLASVLLFDVFLKLAHFSVPRILRDLLTAFAYIGLGLALLRQSGGSISDIITTSAVLTAVIGFSLQDSLGNIMGGLALQMERTINIGDWVKIDQNVGRVKEIRWRHTAIETRNWDTLIIPNSVLMKSQVVILGRREGLPSSHRQWVFFNVDFRYSPTDVIARVNEALQSAPIERVAAEPKIHCILYDFKDSYCQYAVRYWLTDLAVDDPTDSLVRTRIYFALKRASIPLSIPASSIFLTEESEERKELKRGREIDHRLEALKRVDLFHSMTEEELRDLAGRLLYAPFAAGEVMTRQGAEAHWLYIIIRGKAEVQVSVDGNLQKSVAILGAGQFFGEMSLMTGERRAATVVALEDVECYRLDKEAFQHILRQRPEMAEDISRVLAHRRVELDAVREGLDIEAKRIRMSAAQRDILNRIRNFFGLG